MGMEGVGVWKFDLYRSQFYKIIILKALYLYLYTYMLIKIYRGWEWRSMLIRKFYFIRG